MNEQVERLADDLLQIAQAAQRRANPHGIDSAVDDIKEALKLAIKQVNQAQHREEQRRAAAQRAAIDKVTGPGGYITTAVIDQARAEFERNEQKLDQAREVAAAQRSADKLLTAGGLDESADKLLTAAIDRAAAVEVSPLPELDQYFR